MHVLKCMYLNLCLYMYLVIVKARQFEQEWSRFVTLCELTCICRRNGTHCKQLTSITQDMRFLFVFSSCHLLTFDAVAATTSYCIWPYTDRYTGIYRLLVSGFALPLVVANTSVSACRLALKLRGLQSSQQTPA